MDLLVNWGWTALYILEIVCGIGLLILVHEFGHFIFAKIHGVRVEVFSLGMGPALLSYRKGLGFRQGSSVKEYEGIQKGEGEGLNRVDPRAIGETEYRLSWILPLGGYVKMAGEVFDTLTGDPRELGSKSTWVRLQIFAAGALMNLVFVFPICVAMYLVGKVEALPIVGDIDIGSAEWASGLQKGDLILSIERVVDRKGEVVSDKRRPIRSIQEYREVAILSDPGTKLTVKVLRPRRAVGRWDGWATFAPDGRATGPSEIASAGPLLVPHPDTALKPVIDGAEEMTVEVVTAGSEGYGLSPYTFPVVGAVEKGSAAEAAGLAPGDQILEVNGEPLRSFGHLQSKVLESPDALITLLVRSADGKERSVTAKPKTRERRVLVVDDVMAAMVESVKGGSPGAAAGMLPGDRIIQVNGQETPTWGSLVEQVRDLGGRKVTLRIQRGNELEEVECVVGVDIETGKGVLGVTARYGDTVMAVPDGTPWAAAGFQVGDVLKRVAGAEVKNGFLDLANAATLARDGEAIEVVVEREGTAQTLKVTPETKREGTLGVARKVITVEKRYPFGEAIGTGLGDGTRFMRMTVKMFEKLFRGHESAKGLAGPIGIMKSSYHVAQEGFGNFLWFLGLITVSLGVFNLLPVPLLDGGHIMLMLIGAVRGKPLSEKALNRALWVGLILIGTLIIFVTYNDITR